MHIAPATLESFIPTLDTITRSPEPLNGNYIPPLLPNFGRWFPAADGDAAVRGLYRRHAQGREHKAHAAEARGTLARMTIGGSDRLVLITYQTDALIVFRESRQEWIDPLLAGVQCTLFRNEGHFRCASLVREAVDEWARKKWPHARLFTLVAGRRIVASNPGKCFITAGWRRCGVTIGGLIVLELPPAL